MTADAMGGVWTYTNELVRELCGAGARVLVATMGEEPEPRRIEPLARIPGATVETSSWSLEWMAEPWDGVEAAGDWLLELAEGFRPDVVHLNNLGHGSLPFGVPVVTVVHSCVLSWWRAVHGEEAPPRWDRYERLVTRGLRSSDAVVAPTRAMLAEAERYYGPLPRSLAIPNGRDPGPFLSRSGHSTGDGGPGGGPANGRTDEPAVFACGRVWDRAKNLAVLERVAPRLPWPVRVAGSARHPEGGERRPGGVVALGEIPPADVASELARAPIFVHPARYEPFGLAPLEAALSGCALVLGDIPTLREVWGDTATWVAPDDADAITRRLVELIDDPELRRKRGAAARARALELSPRRMADAYLALYRSLVPATTRPRPIPAAPGKDRAGHALRPASPWAASASGTLEGAS